MKNIILAAVILMLFAGPGHSKDGPGNEPGQLFFAANSYYQKQDYAKALEEYRKILDLGFESGSLYYNMGNCFFKLGKTGYAILYYEKALRMMPQDGDLKSNLAYARSIAGISDSGQGLGNPITNAIKAPLGEFSLRTTAVISLALYLLMILIATVFIVNPLFSKKFQIFLPIAIILAIAGFAAFGIRFYYEEILKYGIVVVKQADCKYEPIDKSTTYYKLQEGDKVDILKSGPGWRRIKRSDGKIAWVESGSVEEI